MNKSLICKIFLLYLRINNTIFSNCHSEYGYLFYIKNTENIYSEQKILISNSTFSGN